MSVNAVEVILWELARQGPLAHSFADDAEQVLSSCKISEQEKLVLKSLDLKTLASWGIEPLLIMQAWNAVKGPDCVAEYLLRMNRQDL